VIDDYMDEWMALNTPLYYLNRSIEDALVQQSKESQFLHIFPQ
jgi:hypothetical protein